MCFGNRGIELYYGRSPVRESKFIGDAHPTRLGWKSKAENKSC